MRRHEGDDREGHHAHARHRGRRRRRRRSARRRVRLIATSSPDEPIAFAGGALDRAAHLRTDEEWLAVALRDPGSRALVVGPAGARPEPVALEPSDAEGALFLGLSEAGPLFAVERDGVPLVGLRELTASLPADRLGIVAYASALASWARATRFCGRCGAATEPREAGHVRVCANGHSHHRGPTRW